MAPFTAWLPARPNQDFDLVIKIVGPAASGLLKDWTLIAQAFIRTGLSVMTQQGRLNGEFGDFVLHIRLATHSFSSMGYGCDVLVHLGHTTPEFRRFGLQPGSVLLWEPPPEQRGHPILPDGVIAYQVPLRDLCLRHGEGQAGKGLAALGALLHLLGVQETTLCRWTPSLSAPRSFTAGHDYARHDIEKRDAYSLPATRVESQRRMLLSPEQAILLGFAVSACECRTACDAELMASPARWAAKHLAIAGSMVSAVESDSHPGVQAYRRPQGKVMALLRGNDSAIASCLNGCKVPHVFVADDIPAVIRLLITGHDLIRTGLSDGVGVLIEDAIALRHQTVEVRALLDMMRREHTVVPSPVIHSGRERSVMAAERDGDGEADVGYVAWGAAQGVVRDAVCLCRGFGLRVAGLYPKQLVPFHSNNIESFAKTVGRVVIVESGQTQGYWDRLRGSFSFDYATLMPPSGQSLTPMDIFLREGLGAV
jgi:hypothetical protein